MPHNSVASLIEDLAAGVVEIVDLTQQLHENTPMIKLPEPFLNTPGFAAHEISRYDDRGPAWAWRWLELGEHAGTHLDAPIHWVTGKDGLDVSNIPLPHLSGPAIVIDKSVEVANDPDYLLTVEEIKAFEDEHGPLPENGWLLFRTGWESRAHDEEAFLNASSGQPRSPGFDAGCARWLAEESPFIGVGVETVGIDAGAAAGFDPPFPVHYFLLGAGKYGVTQLANLGSLPPTGAFFVAAPLKLVDGTGSPVRAFALAPRG